MSRDVHRITVIVGPNPNHGKNCSYGTGKMLARAVLGISENGPDYAFATGGTKASAMARAIKELMNLVRYHQQVGRPAPVGQDGEGTR